MASGDSHRQLQVPRNHPRGRRDVGVLREPQQPDELQRLQTTVGNRGSPSGSKQGKDPVSEVEQGAVAPSKASSGKKELVGEESKEGVKGKIPAFGARSFASLEGSYDELVRILEEARAD